MSASLSSAGTFPLTSGTMLSLLVPGDERDFNQNSVGGGRLTYEGSSAAHSSLLTARHGAKLSPNNNSPCTAPATLSAGQPLDNRPPPPPGPAANSSGDGVSPPPPPVLDDVSDEPMSAVEQRPSSPLRRPPGRRASSLAPQAARSGKLKRSVGWSGRVHITHHRWYVKANHR